MNRPAHPPQPRASRRLRRLLGLTIALLLPAGTASAAPTLTIRASQDVVTRIGTFRTQDDATPAAAVRAFGLPSSRRHEGEGCRVEWRALRLRIYFANFGTVAPVVPTCSSTAGLAQSFTVRSRRFLTWRACARATGRARSARDTRTRASGAAAGGCAQPRAAPASGRSTRWSRRSSPAGGSACCAGGSARRASSGAQTHSSERSVIVTVERGRRSASSLTPRHHRPS
jgi:hypothetical protein